jgi:hypothetical protein
MCTKKKSRGLYHVFELMHTECSSHTFLKILGFTCHATGFPKVRLFRQTIYLHFARNLVCKFLYSKPPVVIFSLCFFLQHCPFPAPLALIGMATKNCVALWLGVIYDSQATNIKQCRLLERTPIPSLALILVAWKSYITPCQPECTKIPPEIGECSYFLNEKSPKQHFFDKNF